MLNTLHPPQRQVANMPKCLQIIKALQQLDASHVYRYSLLAKMLGCTGKPVGQAMAVLNALGITTRISPQNHNQPAEFSINSQVFEYAVAMRLYEKDGHFICTKCGEMKHVSKRSEYANYKCVCNVCIKDIQKIHLAYQHAYKRPPKKANMAELFAGLAAENLPEDFDFRAGARLNFTT